jgi:hypothetical protein
MASPDWIEKATQKKGALHRRLGVPSNKTIPKKKLTKAATKGGIEGKEARLAETLEKLPHGHAAFQGPKRRRKK